MLKGKQIHLQAEHGLQAASLQTHMQAHSLNIQSTDANSSNSAPTPLPTLVARSGHVENGVEYHISWCTACTALIATSVGELEFLRIPTQKWWPSAIRLPLRLNSLLLHNTFILTTQSNNLVILVNQWAIQISQPHRRRLFF